VKELKGGAKWVDLGIVNQIALEYDREAIREAFTFKETPETEGEKSGQKSG
jgi:hypothetical protein